MMIIIIRVSLSLPLKDDGGNDADINDITTPIQGALFLVFTVLGGFFTKERIITDGESKE